MSPFGLRLILQKIEEIKKRRKGGLTKERTHSQKELLIEGEEGCCSVADSNHACKPLPSQPECLDPETEVLDSLVLESEDAVTNEEEEEKQEEEDKQEEKKEKVEEEKNEEVKERAGPLEMVEEDNAVSFADLPASPSFRVYCRQPPNDFCEFGCNDEELGIGAKEGEENQVDKENECDGYTSSREGSSKGKQKNQKLRRFRALARGPIAVCTLLNARRCLKASPDSPKPLLEKGDQ